MSTPALQHDRLHPIQWLAEQAQTEIDIDQLRAGEDRAQEIQAEFKVLPTIGCEVEVSWASLHPDLMEEFFSDLDPNKTYTTLKAMVRDLDPERRKEFEQQKAEADAVTAPLYQATTANGIPKGKDPHWEFANKPTYSWPVLAKEIDLLMDAGLIPEGRQHAMHVTLGGVSVDGYGPQIILPGLELLGVSGGRISAATKSKMHSWARRNTHSGGVRGRLEASLELDQPGATEFRTLATAKPEDHRTIFQAAQMLGTVLLSHRSGADAQNAGVIEIGKQWQGYRDTMTDLWDARGLPTDNTWSSPYDNPEVWLGWAECLDRRNQQDSPEQKTVTALRRIISRTEALLQEL